MYRPGEVPGSAGLTLLAAAFVVMPAVPVHAQQSTLEVDILYIEQRVEHPPVLSNLVSWPEDEGERGASLAISDNNTTGRFLGQSYRLDELIFEPDESPATRNERIREKLAEGARLVVANLPASDLTVIATLPEAADDLIFNAQSMDGVLRNEQCQPNVLHTIPSRAMLSDALAQYLYKRQWEEVFLIEGNSEKDKAFAESLRRSMTKFSLDIVQSRTWIEDADMRRSASTEVPVFTQARSYDVVVVADEQQDFSQYILYNTWLPRPVAGSAGLTPVVWSPVIEQWGAAQLQSRFRKLAERDMTSRDYSNWAAVRSMGEAVTRTGSAQPADILDYVLSDEFELAGFKGAPLSYRHWNGQMRQSVQLVHPKAVVATAPIEGFLHPVTELDTLGLDEPESLCEGFQRTRQ
ncbi:ABC transporter substrate-binding protein [Granulosicoccus sp. 3-233]|uniref:ABC transporter substrate-binding protein n=1 Tax=Granulosicoccus sp. 3-233 TaxID=3417969 RepID=UPI003D32BAA0